MRTNLKGVFATYKFLRDGTHKAYWYHRRTGKRLNGEPGSPEFIADYADAEKNVSEYNGGTFNGLIRDYTLSDEFEKLLAPSTKKEYRRMLLKTEVAFGDMPLTALEDPRGPRRAIHAICGCLVTTRARDALSLGGVDQSLQNPLKRSDANAV